jgi:hypothetical protein
MKYAEYAEKYAKYVIQYEGKCVEYDKEYYKQYAK